MENGWYYARNDKKAGPFSPKQLKDLADAGTILRTDTVWKAGVERGVQADRVKNLFPALVSAAPPMPSFDDADVPRLVPLVPFVNRQAEEASVPSALSPSAVPPPVAEKPTPKAPVSAQPKPAMKGRAVALSGAIIVSQDGARAKYRMICKPCGHQDSSCQALTITNKSFKRNFFCPKCRKSRVVAIQCQLR